MDFKANRISLLKGNTGRLASAGAAAWFPDPFPRGASRPNPSFPLKETSATAQRRGMFVSLKPEASTGLYQTSIWFWRQSSFSCESQAGQRCPVRRPLRAAAAGGCQRAGAGLRVGPAGRASPCLAGGHRPFTLHSAYRLPPASAPRLCCLQCWKHPILHLFPLPLIVPLAAYPPFGVWPTAASRHAL